MSIEEIQTFKTSDGSIFERLRDAEDYEEEMLIKDAVRGFWREHGYSGMSTHDASDICLNQIGQLMTALNARSD